MRYIAHWNHNRRPSYRLRLIDNDMFYADGMSGVIVLANSRHVEHYTYEEEGEVVNTMITYYSDIDNGWVATSVTRTPIVLLSLLFDVPASITWFSCYFIIMSPIQRTYTHILNTWYNTCMIEYRPFVLVSG